jgi:hypothetical protein
MRERVGRLNRTTVALRKGGKLPGKVRGIFPGTEKNHYNTTTAL